MSDLRTLSFASGFLWGVSTSAYQIEGGPGAPAAREAQERSDTSTPSRRLSADPVPLYVTENGCSGDDVVDDAGEVHDGYRVDHLTEHLAACVEAVEDGVDVRGYFVRSLVDNFEWSKGYRPRFGLVHVGYSAQTRTPKDSYRWYQSLIGRNA